MPLTQEHDEKRMLTPEQINQKCKLTFEEIVDLPAIERAEVLEALVERQASVRVKAHQDADIPFSYTNSHMRGAPEQRYVIPGGKKDPAVLPLRAATYVAVNRDYPQFGGATIATLPPRPDGFVPHEPVPARPGLITFELVLT